MMLTTKGRYAAMAIVDMEIHSKKNSEVCKPVALQDISKRQDIAQAYLEQIFAMLKSKNIVKAVRGPGGGYMLLGDSKEVTMGDIIFAADESLKISRCSAENIGKCMKNNTQCVTHDLWNGLNTTILDYLSSVTLSDVVDGSVNMQVRNA